MKNNLKTLLSFILILAIPACTEAPKQQNFVEISEHLHDIEAISNQIAFAYSYGTGNFYKTENGGENWFLVSSLDSIYYEQMQFFDENNGWMIGSPHAILKTADGGQNWTSFKIEEDTPDCAIYGMIFIDADNGYVAPFDRTSSRIYSTVDGGKSWKLLNVLEGKMILNLEWMEGSLFGSGNNVILNDLHKENNWKTVFEDTTRQVGQIRDFASSGNGQFVAASFNGFIVEKAGNGNWRSTQITKNRLRSIVYNNGKWVAAGSGDQLQSRLLSSNNARLWQSLNTEYEDIHRLHTSGNSVWLVGKKGLAKKLP